MDNEIYPVNLKKLPRLLWKRIYSARRLYNRCFATGNNTDIAHAAYLDALDAFWAHIGVGYGAIRRFPDALPDYAVSANRDPAYEYTPREKLLARLLVYSENKHKTVKNDLDWDNMDDWDLSPSEPGKIYDALFKHDWRDDDHYVKTKRRITEFEFSRVWACRSALYPDGVRKELSCIQSVCSELRVPIYMPRLPDAAPPCEYTETSFGM